MSHKPRYYQLEAEEAVFDYWGEGGGNPLIDLATGTGKSLVLGRITKRLCHQWPGIRILVLVHVKELVQQDLTAIIREWPGAPVGVNSAGLGRRDRHAQILVASIQSVARETAATIGERDVVLVDESHLIPPTGTGQYQTLIGNLQEATPDLRLGGLTATPYRLGSGRLDEGPDAMFDKTVYTYDIGRAVADGFLVPLIAPGNLSTHVDLSQVKRSGGEFNANAAEAAINTDPITKAACKEIIELGVNKRAWLLFCSGVEHAYAVRDCMRSMGISAETVTGETSKGERDRLLREFQQGRIRCMTNANVLTTGFDAPIADLIGMLRGTLSTSLYVQMLGRVTRCIGADIHESRRNGKSDALVLDFVGNVSRHGPVDALDIAPQSSKSVGKVSVDSVRAKRCPACDTMVAINAMTCNYCGHEWERQAEPKHDPNADRDITILSRDLAVKWFPVEEFYAYPHEKYGSPLAVRMEYVCGKKLYSEWLSFEKFGKPKAMAHKWWRSVVGTPAPADSADAIKRMKGEAKIVAIKIRKGDGKRFDVTHRRVKRPDGRMVEIDENYDSIPVNEMLEV